MSEQTGKICPYCQSKILPGQPVEACNSCNIPHHADCWRDNGGCTTFGCAASSMRPDGHGASTVGIDLTRENMNTSAGAYGTTVSSIYPPPGSLGTPYGRPSKNPTTACLLNLLLLGAGYFYLGRAGKGIGLLLLAIVFGLLTYGVGTLCILIYAMVDCYSTAEKMNRSSYPPM